MPGEDHTPDESAGRPVSRKIGRPGRPVRVLAFSGGGFDAAMQLGVTHALMVLRLEPPDLVAGISAGALNSAVLAEVLKAGDEAEDDAESLLLQEDRFRVFLEECLSLPSELLTKLLPDTYQVESRLPLSPLETPAQSRKEREDRSSGVSAKAGVINLVNALLTLRVSLGDMTRMSRAYLGLVAALELRPYSRRVLGKASALFWLLVVGLRNVRSLASITRYLMPAAMDLGVASIRKLLRIDPERYSRFDEALEPEKGRFRTGKRKNGRSAGYIIFRFEVFRKLRTGALWILAFLVNALLWLLALCISPAVALYPTPDRTRPPGLPLRVLGELLSRVLWHTFRRYSVENGLCNAQVLRDIFVRMFDSSYYGQLDEVGLRAVLDEALKDSGEPALTEKQGRTLNSYAEGRTSISVAFVAADLVKGELFSIPGETTIVDGLLAATAVAPFFSPRSISVPVENTTSPESVWCVDGVNVSNDPTHAVVNILRDHADPDATMALIYPVNPIPVMKDELPGRRSSYPNLIEVALRAAELNKFRDARLSWRMTELYTRVIPGNGILYQPSGDDGKKFVRAHIRSIEPDERAVDTGARLFRAIDESDRRRILLEAIAEGCRSTIRAAVPGQLRDWGGNDPDPVSCWEFVEAFRNHIVSRVKPRTAKPDCPGISAVCDHCRIRSSGPGAAADSQGTAEPAKRDKRTVHARSLRVPGEMEFQGFFPDWPRRDRSEAEHSDGPVNPVTTTLNSRKLPLTRVEGWPFPRRVMGEELLGVSRPLVTLLFSGGVFRGVFLLGVVNALEQIGAAPDLIAGASVGSITAAMVADVFAAEPGERRLKLGMLCSTFMALDRIILTDRLADLTRSITIRGAQTRFSLRDLDHVLRRFDEKDHQTFSRDVRQVLAGVERLLYISPFEFKELVELASRGKNREFVDMARGYLRRLLEREGVQQEVLGAEPISRLIDSLIIGNRTDGHLDQCRSVRFDTFHDKGIIFMATVTNLTRGRLDVLGCSDSPEHRRVSLREGLLASSAFPGVFRPRWSWELFQGNRYNEQYTDGGVMDNLPLDSVAEFIKKASEERLVAGRPVVDGQAVPHLLFTSSLEVDPPRDLSKDAQRKIVRSWIRLRERVTKFGCNRKVDAYRTVQKHLRLIYNSHEGTKPFEPCDLEVVVVKPKWLCGTFAFHPMLGFRRNRQAESIAHGCASTIAELQRLKSSNEGKRWIQAWGLDIADGHPGQQPGGLEPAKTAADSNDCVFRFGCPCPFSPGEVAKLNLQKKAIAESLIRIFTACRHPETHRADRQFYEKTKGNAVS